MRLYPQRCAQSCHTKQQTVCANVCGRHSFSVGGFGLFVLPCVVYANLRYPDRAPIRRVLTPVGLCGLIGFGLAVVNATMTFINIAAGSESGADDGQCGVPPQ